MKKAIIGFLCVLVLSAGVQAAFPEHKYHVIESGDTLRKLAAKYETSVLDLLDLNPGITPDNLLVGGKIRLPLEPLWSYHVVQKGDNARSLAAWYKVPVEALREANGIKGDKLTLGETIRIPMHLYLGEVETKELTHKVEIGDTLYEIALKYDVTLQKLMQWNQLEDANSILAGQILIVG